MYHFNMTSEVVRAVQQTWVKEQVNLSGSKMKCT